ncbi:MAG: tetratricopeptide repeat protein [Archangium sp.]
MSLDRHAARQLREGFENVGPAPDSAHARYAAIAAIERSLSLQPAPPRKRELPRWLFAAVILGAIVAASALVLLRTESPRVRVVASRGQIEAPDQRSFRTRDGSVLLSLPSGATVELLDNSDVELRDEGTRVLLRVGAVAAAVVSEDQRPLTIETFDTQIFTRGARLKVDATGGCDGGAKVTVSDGAVLVRRHGVEAPVMTGQTWPTCPEKLTSPPPETPEPPKPTPPSPRKREAPSLEKLNAQYARALELQRAGRFDDAIRALDEVLAGPSDSPLAEPALAQKLRWLSPSRPAEARRAAQQYLQRFPMGPARADAETLLLDSP